MANKTKTVAKTNSRKKEVAFTDPRLNELASIISGIWMGQLQPGKPLNKTNSLDFIRAQLRGEVLTLDRIALSRMYMQFGLCQAIAEVPVFDAFRNEPIIRAYVRSKNKITSPEPAAVEYKPQGLLKRISGGIFSRYNESDKEKSEKNEKPIKGTDLSEQITLEKRKEWEKIANQIDEEELKNQENNLATPAEPWKTKAIMMAAKESRLYDALKSAAIWGRVFGGGAVIINTPDHAGRPDEPLDLSRLRKGDRVDWIVADCWELMGNTPDVQVSSPDTMVNWQADCPFDYYGQKIHKSRVLLFRGKDIPSMFRPLGRGWGMSYFEHLARTLTITWKAQNSRAELLDDAKTDIYMLKGLNQQATNPALNEALKNRLRIIQETKNYGSGVALDSEDEFKQKQTSFSGFDKMQEQDRYDCAADARIVMTKLYGMTPGGFSNGDNDRASYEDMVRSEVQNPCIPNLITAYKVLSVITTGELMDIDADFPPLTKDKQETDIKTKQEIYNLCVKALTYGSITPGQFARILNEQNVFFGVEVSSKLPVAPDPSLTKFTSNPLMNKA